MEDQDVTSLHMLVRCCVEIVQEFHALVLGVDVNGTFDVTAVVLIRIPTIYNFERRDIPVVVPPD